MISLADLLLPAIEELPSPRRSRTQNNLIFSGVSENLNQITLSNLPSPPPLQLQKHCLDLINGPDFYLGFMTPSPVTAIYYLFLTGQPPKGGMGVQGEYGNDKVIPQVSFCRDGRGREGRKEFSPDPCIVPMTRLSSW